MMMKTQLGAAIIFGILITHFSCTAQHKDNKHALKHEHGFNYENQAENKQENVMKICKPNRVTHSYEQTINGTIEEIFPLYCPVREMEWMQGWHPKAVYSNFGVVEPGCVFVTEHDGHETAWFVTVYDIEQGRIEMLYHTPGVIFTKLEIRVTPISDRKTKAVITYSKTSLSAHGDEVLKRFTKEYYNNFMTSWEKAMNHFLKTGEMLTN